MAAKDIICSNCGYTGKPKILVKGSMSTEILLWILLIVPGLIYSLWRSGSRYKGCPQCGSADLVPLDSPRGKKLSAELSA